MNQFAQYLFALFAILAVGWVILAAIDPMRRR